MLPCERVDACISCYLESNEADRKHERMKKDGPS